VTSPTYDPTSGPVDPGVEQSDPRLGEAMPSGTFADSEMERFQNGEQRGAVRPVGLWFRGRLHCRYRQG
jgi:hypothetical protein